MDTPILIILILFAAAVVYLGIRYRQEIMGEVEDVLDGDDDDAKTAPPPAQEQPAPPPKRDEDEADEFGEAIDDVLAPSHEEAPPPPSIAPGTTPARPIAPSGAPQPLTEPKPAAPWDVETEGEPEPEPARPVSRGELQPAPAPEPAAPTTGTGSAIVPDQVKFSAYYPRETAPQVWQPLVAYAYRQSASSDVIKDVGTVLGTRTNEFRRAEDSARVSVQEGAMIIATPVLPGCQVNPPQITLGFYEPFHRFDFKVRATSAPLDQAVNGLLTFTVEGVIVAELPLSLFVGRFVGESMTGAVTKSAYNSIFCSYSRDDTQIVERVERAYKALGMTYLRDVVSLKSGQNWNEELLKLIENADIFQLFWSQSASESKYVRQEWEHALKANRAIRPVYWQQPIPRVPDELRSLHFAYTPELDD